MPTASQVARYFLALGQLSVENGEENENISNLKLQKLLYYAQGFHLAIHGKPLFSEEIQAWKHGPVVSEVYHQYKDAGANGIPYFASDDVLDEGSKELIRDVYSHYGQFTAWRLRQLTHDEPPWRETYRPGEMNLVISHEKLIKYFKTQIED